MAIAFVASANTTSTAAFTMTVTLPSHSEGDLLILSFVHDYNSVNQKLASVNESYTELTEHSQSGAAHQASIWYKVAGASESDPVATYSLDTAVMACLASAYSGVDGTTPLDVAVSTWTIEDPGDTSVDAPSITTVTDGAMLVSVATADENDTFTKPTGMTLVDNVVYGNMVTSSAYEIISTAEATGVRTWVFAQNTDEIAAVNFALRPASGGTTLTATGIASAESIGSPTITTGSVDLSTTGIASQESIGSPVVTQPAAEQGLTATGIASEESLGLPTVTTGAVDLSTSGIASAESFGSPTLTTGAVNLSVTGISSEESFGTPLVTQGFVLQTTGIASTESVGTPTITTGAVNLAVTGIPSEESFGSPTVVAAVAQALTLTGIASLEAFGSPVVALEGEKIIRIDGLGEKVLNTNLASTTLYFNGTNYFSV